MDWAQPAILFWIVPVAALLVVVAWRSEDTMPVRRRWLLQAVRGVVVVLLLAALAGPAIQRQTDRQAVMLLVDQSESLGPAGRQAARERALSLAAALPGDAMVGVMAIGQEPVLWREPSDAPPGDLTEAAAGQTPDASGTHLAAGLDLARAMLPPGYARRLILVSDGVETRGDAAAAAVRAAAQGVVIDVAPVAGPARPDARVLALRPSRLRLHEGARLELAAELESSVPGEARVRLFENGIEVAQQTVMLEAGEFRSVRFSRTPPQRGLYHYQVRLDGLSEDAIAENNSALALVDVQGQPLLLYVDGDPSEAHYLMQAAAQEGIRLELRPAEAMPRSVAELAGYDGAILSDVPAFQVGEQAMGAVRQYVEQLGGGLLMIGGTRSFGVGGYFRTPLEEILPVKIQPPDQEERYSVALMLVIDRSGSMSGGKIEICKSAAVATIDLLQSKDYIGVVTFDSNAQWVVPMTRVHSKAGIAGQIATIQAGGGTNIHPGMTAGHEALRSVTAKAKHMIVLTDGQSGGSGYEAMAATMRAQGITVSTVAVGQGADSALLQRIANSGGGSFYQANDPATLPQIFTQDAMTHLGKLIREETFTPQQVETHPMLRGLEGGSLPPLLGYVKTRRRLTAQTPLVTDLDDPLLAHWRFGMGKVTAFTSDSKSRWAALWLANWPEGYSQFWAQVIREVARPPQGREMDLRLAEQGEIAAIEVDLLEDAARFAHGARVEAEVHYLPQGDGAHGLEEVAVLTLDQAGPGRYRGQFALGEAGVYLVRARSGTRTATGALVRNVSSEAATGRIDEPLLDTIAGTTGGHVLTGEETALTPLPAGHARWLELRGGLLLAALLVFLVDVVIRRWDPIAAAWQGRVEAART